MAISPEQKQQIQQRIMELRGTGQQPTVNAGSGQPLSFEQFKSVLNTSTTQPEQGGARFKARVGESPITAGAKAVANLPGSFGRFVGGIGKAIINPIDTVKGIGSVVGGGIRTAGEALGVVEDTQDTEAEQTFDAFTQSLKDRFGSLDALQRTATEDPFGFGADVATLFAGGLGAARKLGLTRTTRALEGVSRGAEAVGRTAVSPIRAVTTKIADKVRNADVSLLEKSKIIAGGTRSKIQKITPDNISPERWIISRGFSGTPEQMIDDIAKYTKTTKRAVDGGLASIKDTIPRSQVPVELKKGINLIKNDYRGVADLGGETATFIKRLDSLAKQKSYTLTDLNEIKRIFQNKGQIYKSAMGGMRDTVRAEALGSLTRTLKKFVEQEAKKRGFKTVEALNKETQVGVEIMKAMNKRLGTSQSNSWLSLSDLGVFGGGAIVTGNPITSTAIVFARRLSQNPVFVTKFGQATRKLSKKSRAILSTAMTTGKMTPESSVIFLNILTDILQDNPELMSDFTTTRSNPSLEPSGL